MRPGHGLVRAAERGEIEYGEFKNTLIDAAHGDRKTSAMAFAVLEILAIRRMPIGKNAFAHVMECTDYELARTWLRRSLRCASTDEIFA